MIAQHSTTLLLLIAMGVFLWCKNSVKKSTIARNYDTLDGS